MASKGMIIGAVVVVAIIAYVAMNPDLIPASVTNTQLADTPADPNISKVQAYKGPVDINNRASDTIETSTVYVDGTNYVVNYYKKVNDVPVFIIASASNTAPIDVEAEDKTIWAEIVIPNAQAFYLDGNAITISHVRVGLPVICDWNNDNIDTYCYPLDVTGYTREDQDPGFTWFVRLFDEGSISINTPADLTALGQGKVACRINWEVTMDTEGDAEFITKWLITLNQTESTDMWFPADSWAKFDGIRFGFDKDGLVGDDKATTYVYTNRLADDYLTQWQDIDNQGAYPLKYLINGDNEFNFNVKVFTNFDADDEGLELTLSLTTENARGTPTTITDAVKCLET